MHESTDGKSKSNDDPIPDSHFAELERAAERCRERDPAIEPTSIEEEHLRIFAIIDEIAAPIRKAITQFTMPLTLPDYGPLEEIGRGGMGVVYRATNHKTNRIDAIKIIRPDRIAYGSKEDILRLRQRFQRECQLAARVSHEHILPIYQVGEVDGCTWFSMQYVAGPNLHERSRGKIIPLVELVRCIERISRAIDAVHGRGVLHGDIKPQNILFDPETERPMLSDFGLAELTSELKEYSNDFAGTFAYMAPELIEATRNRRAREDFATVRSIASDIFSLGATLGSVLPSRSAATFESFAVLATDDAEKRRDQLRNHIAVHADPALARICLKCLADDPGARYETANQLADDLASWLERPRWNQYFPSLRYLLCYVVAPGLAISGLSVWLLQDHRENEIPIWIAIFISYVPLYIALWTSQRIHRESERARREIWSIWLGHGIASVASLTAIRIQNADELARSIAQFYPTCAAISSVSFFAKSGNFWFGYRWIGAAWAVAAIALAIANPHGPILFGFFAFLTCIVVAKCDSAFADDNPSE